MDLYFFANGLVDGLLLYLVGRITDQRIRCWRLIAAALVGTTGATLWYCLCLGRIGTVLDFLIMLAIAGGMDLVAWGWTSSRSWRIRLGWLFGMSVLLEGLVHLCSGWLRGGLSSGMIFLLAMILCLVAGTAFRLYYHFSGRKEHVGQVRCRFGERWVTFYGWLDSGNLLRDPISQKSVVVVEEIVLEGIQLPKAVPIPYRTIDTQGQILWGYYPDELRLRLMNEEREVDGVIAEVHHPIRIHGCQAVLPAAWIPTDE